MAQLTVVSVTAKKVVSPDGKVMTYAFPGKDITVFLGNGGVVIPIGDNDDGDSLVLANGFQITGQVDFDAFNTAVSASDQTGS